MKVSKSPRLTPRELRVLGLIGLVAAIIVSVWAGANIGISRSVAGGGGFLVMWEAARGFLFTHAAPYGDSVARLTQNLAYGRSALPGENPYFLTMPFFLLPVYFPFGLIADPVVARGLWMFVAELALIATAFLIFQLIEWEPRRFFLAMFALLAIFNYYSVTALLDGNSSVLVGLMYLAILYAYAIEQDELVGALFVFTLFHWEIGLPFQLLMIWKVFDEKRSRVLSGFGMTIFILLALSFLLYPGWPGPFVSANLTALSSKFGVSTGVVFSSLWPAYSVWLTRGLLALLVLVLAFEWSSARRADFRHFVWVVCLTLAATPLLGFRIEIGDLVVLFPGLALIFAAATDRWRVGYWLTILLLLIVLLLPWGLFTRWIFFQSQNALDWLFLFLPTFTILGLYWTRWWFLRPPRTWLDHVHSLEAGRG